VRCEARKPAAPEMRIRIREAGEVSDSTRGVN
jgi:hypothetical protein